MTDKFTIGSLSDACLLDGDIWVAGAAAGAVMRLDPDTHRRRAVPVGANASAPACGAGGVWAVSDSGRLIQIDPATNTVKGTADVGAGVGARRRRPRRVANPVAGTVSRVDAERSAVTATVALGAADEPVAVAIGAGSVWAAEVRQCAGADRPRLARGDRAVSPRQRAARADRRGQPPLGRRRRHGRRSSAGTRPRSREHRSRIREFDPATAYSPAGLVLSPTNDGLTAFRRVGGAAGATLVPDLAETLPCRPTTAAPTASLCAVASASRPAGPYARATSSAASSDRQPPSRGLRRARRDRIGHGRRRARNARDPLGAAIRPLYLRPGAAVRLRCPARNRGAPPHRGGHFAYRIARFEQGRPVRLERNRFYRTWSAPAKPDGYPDVIELVASAAASRRSSTTSAQAVRPDEHAKASPALTWLRRTDPGLIREIVRPATVWLFLNTRVLPFDRRDARRAVSLAIDRRAVVASLGGSHIARPTCHILPPTIPGYRPGCPGVDLLAARRLVALGHTRRPRGAADRVLLRDVDAAGARPAQARLRNDRAQRTRLPALTGSTTPPRARKPDCTRGSQTIRQRPTSSRPFASRSFIERS